MAQAQADADFGIAGAIASATVGKAAAAAGSMFTAAASKAAGDLTRALNAAQTGFVDAATAASLKATKTIAAAETVERKAVAKADVVLAQDLQSAWGTYAAAECSAVTLNARERATIGADYKKDVAGAELAAVKEVAPARKTSMVAAAEANGVYHVRVTGIIADFGILGGEIEVEATKAKSPSISGSLGKTAVDFMSLLREFLRGTRQGWRGDECPQPTSGERWPAGATVADFERLCPLRPQTGGEGNRPSSLSWPHLGLLQAPGAGQSSWMPHRPPPRAPSLKLRKPRPLRLARPLVNVRKGRRLIGIGPSGRRDSGTACRWASGYRWSPSTTPGPT